MIEYYDYDEILLALEDPVGEGIYAAEPRYIDPTTDYGFKRIFGTEANKDLLLSFLNALFKGRKEIVDLYYNKNEHVGDAEENGAVIFDLTCTGVNGGQFILEVQRTSQLNLKRRMLYYGSKLIADQAPKGSRKGWNYAISEVYVIVIMDGFVMPGEEPSEQYLHDICLCNRLTGETFYDDLGFIYISLINFVKAEEELENDFEGWLYVMKNMSTLDKLPLYLRKPIFERLFRVAEYCKMNKEERQMYDVSLKRKWDEYSIQESRIIEQERALAKGLEQGLEQGRQEVKMQADAEKMESALKMRAKGFDIDVIVEVLNLSKTEAEKLS